MRSTGQSAGLKLLDEFVSDGLTQFTSADAAVHLGRSAAATGNLLARLVRDGLLDRVRRGHYAIRQLGTLGTTAAAENVLLSVAAGFGDVRHRVGYRTALDQLDLLAHPSRSIQVALAKPTRSETLSGRRLTIVQEPEAALEGGIAVLAEALGAASSKGVDAERLTSYARVLSWGPALRRIGSLADTLHIAGLAGRLEPLTKPSSDIDLEPGQEASSYRDAKWWVRWDHSPSELQNVLHQ